MQRYLSAGSPCISTSFPHPLHFISTTLSMSTPLNSNLPHEHLCSWYPVPICWGLSIMCTTIYCGMY